ncbi:Oidioi.mRNA.OKI2018_I69.chr1.g3567.t2.cds [Oikopleura dioica]|uniref:Oidioi.mRNA.OKI2018_I69.chr1.g3567.t2.cds n=1 Tax=Oikopleura dioica TaxID=34765 RepID=A0ABN7SUC8_OIKDI|nr:Oidioi.mRNA.OKI2018_I69.chr1.g3567.t2.cds [Oikopleura dioica]
MMTHRIVVRSNKRTFQSDAAEDNLPAKRRSPITKIDPAMTTKTDHANGDYKAHENYHTDEVRTLFVSGLPTDVKQRELHLLFRPYKGFESAVLKFPQKPGKVYPIAPVAFVTFKSKAEAQVPKEELQGEKFDNDYPTTLRLEFAKSNTKNRMKSLKELDTSALPLMMTTGTGILDPLILPADVGTSVHGTGLNSAGMPRGVKRGRLDNFRAHPFTRPVEFPAAANIVQVPQMPMANLMVPQVTMANAMAFQNKNGLIQMAPSSQMSYHGFSKARVTSPNGAVEFTDANGTKYFAQNDQ